MKLLMITGDRSLAEGKHGAFYNTLEEFYKHWDRVDIICPKVVRSSISNRSSEVEPQRPLFGNVFIHPSPWPLIFQPFWIFRAGLRILKTNNYKLETRNYAMTVHEYPPFYNGIGARLLWWKIRIPYILEIFHIPGYPRYSNWKELIYRSLARVFISQDVSRAKAARIMNMDVGKFLELVGVPIRKLCLIPAIYVDLETFRPMALSKEYDLIFIGRLETNKGIDLLLEAIKFSIFNLRFPIKCLIVGEGSLKKSLTSEIDHLKLQDRVLLHGFAKDSKEIAELLNKSKILAMPSYNEGGPRVVIEAMACGVPVLATPVGIVPDLLKNGAGGEIIDWQGEDIAQKARSLLSDSIRYHKLSNEATEKAKAFEKKAAIKNYADKLKEIMQSYS